MIDPNKSCLRIAVAVVFAQSLVMHALFAGEPVANDSPRSDDPLRGAEVLFNAGEYRRAEALFRAELDIPEKPAHGEDRVGVTPKSNRVRIWLSRCHGRLGRKEEALKECVQLARETKEVWGWWNPQDRERLAKTIVENTQTPEQMTEIEQFVKMQPFKEVQEYFDALALVQKGDAAGVVRYLTRSDVPIVVVDSALWRDEIVEKAAGMKPAMIRYAREQIERAARWEATDLCMYHLHHLLQVLPDETFVEPCLGSHQLESRFPYEYTLWRDILKVHRQQCKKKALLHLKGNRGTKETALNLINTLQLYDRETLDAIAVVAVEEYYPTQIRSLLALWRVSGQQFGLEAETTELALKQASNGDRRSALVQAVAWWRSQSAGLDAAAQVSVKTADKDVLEKGRRCRVEMIRLEAVNQLGKSKQP